MLKQFNAIPQAKKAQFVEVLAGNPAGREALEEAKTLAHALECVSEPRTHVHSRQSSTG